MTNWIKLTKDNIPKSDATVNLKMKDGSVVKGVKARMLQWRYRFHEFDSYEVVSVPEIIELPECSIASDVIKQIKNRADVGLSKYGVTLDRDDLSLEEWIQHAIEEVLDLAGYLTKLKKDLKEKLK